MKDDISRNPYLGFPSFPSSSSCTYGDFSQHYSGIFHLYAVFILYLYVTLSPEKVCLYELGYEEKICEDLSSYEEESNTVQRVVNDFNRNKSLIENIIFLLICLFAGAFSGKFGFRMTIILSLTSKVSRNVANSSMKSLSIFRRVAQGRS